MREFIGTLTEVGKLMLIGMSIYAVAMISKPEELQLRQGQLREWWTQQVLKSDSNESNGTSGSSYNRDGKPVETWGF